MVLLSSRDANHAEPTPYEQQCAASQQGGAMEASREGLALRWRTFC